MGTGFLGRSPLVDVVTWCPGFLSALHLVCPKHSKKLHYRAEPNLQALQGQVRALFPEEAEQSRPGEPPYFSCTSESGSGLLAGR